MLFSWSDGNCSADFGVIDGFLVRCWNSGWNGIACDQQGGRLGLDKRVFYTWQVKSTYGTGLFFDSDTRAIRPFDQSIELADNGIGYRLNGKVYLCLEGSILGGWRRYSMVAWWAEAFLPNAKEYTELSKGKALNLMIRF